MNRDEHEDAPLAAIPADWARQILLFWFDEHGYRDWFGGEAAFDTAIAERFGGWIAALRSNPASHFLTDADTALAAAILFDQFPRNLYRGQAKAFATDSLALAIARGAVEKGFDQGLADERRAFFYMPYEHSEVLDDQRESLRLFADLRNSEYLQYAQQHFDIIARFGRFPHRNKALGRSDRPGEEEAIAAGAGW